MPSIGRSIPHDSAKGHVAGRATYIDDVPAIVGELAVDFVGAPVAAGKVVSIDLSGAEKLPGVVGIYTYRDLPGKNVWGSIFHDEPILVEDEVSYLGQPVLVVAATSRKSAARARDLIKIRCTPRQPVLTIDDAVAADSFIGPKRKIERGDVDPVFDSAAHVIDGVFECNGQEQLYFESQAAIAIPGEENSIRVLSSTQSTTEVQAEVASAWHSSGPAHSQSVAVFVPASGS
jgi:xanthine dehydrogenase large subunit